MTNDNFLVNTLACLSYLHEPRKQRSCWSVGCTKSHNFCERIWSTCLVTSSGKESWSDGAGDFGSVSLGLSYLRPLERFIGSVIDLIITDHDSRSDTYCARDGFSVIANWHNSHECSCCLNFNWKGAGLSVSVIFSAEVSNLNCKSWAVRKKEDHDGHQLSGWEDVNDNTRKNLDVLWKRGSTGGGFGHSYIIGENVPGLNPMQTQQILFFLKTNARTTSPIDSYGGLALNWTEFFVCWRAHSEMTDSCRSIMWAWIDFGYVFALCLVFSIQHGLSGLKEKLKMARKGSAKDIGWVMANDAGDPIQDETDHFYTILEDLRLGGSCFFFIMHSCISWCSISAAVWEPQWLFVLTQFVWPGTAPVIEIITSH